jgi:hypothetical protein
MSVEEVVERTSISYGVAKARMQGTYEVFDRVGAGGTVVRVYPEELFCNKRISGRCDALIETHMMYSDYDHPSPFAMSILSDMILEAFDGRSDPGGTRRPPE